MRMLLHAHRLLQTIDHAAILGISFAVTNIPYFLKLGYLLLFVDMPLLKCFICLSREDTIRPWNCGHYLLGSCCCFCGLTSVTSNSW
ncbi:hypothetical protein JHK85_018174 [Glycine max]|uniref:Uncharacterized protein n=1 Tax=Glycine max TaxID=3847 RepID=A0A0R0J0T7_SOYBN|nr:hypothetical protein JHK85_018174 [Glycine max]KAH1085700.1 hypothetical protein GYH30_017601 [Glycine max]